MSENEDQAHPGWKPGWYEDGHGVQRWWDGSQWSETTAALSAPKSSSGIDGRAARVKRAYFGQSRGVKIALPVLLGVGLIVGIGIGSAGQTPVQDSPQYAALSAKQKTLKSDNDDMAVSNSQLKDQVSLDQNQIDNLTAKGKEYDEKAAGLKAREDAVAKREKTADAADAAKKATSFEDGTWAVGTDIQPGTYRGNTEGGQCYWARLSGLSGDFSELLANDNTTGQVTVTIAPTDKGFTAERCGTWTKVG